MACQFSMSYVVAAALMDGAFGLNQLTEQKIRDPKIHDWLQSEGGDGSGVRKDLSSQSACNHGDYGQRMVRKFTGRADFAKGDHRKPMTEEESTAKFLGLTAGVLGEKKAKKAMDIVLDLENLDSVVKLVRCLK